MISDADLDKRLSVNLPANHKFHLHHVSTPPTLTCALYTPPSRRPPEKTYCESHLLLFSHIRNENSTDAPMAVFGLEVLVYTTAQLTTVFVSKADSTGFAASLPSVGSSVIRSVTSVFISDLITRRHRPDRRLVVSLFARAQDQYLFPGSAENRSKHILSDRQLIRWWCRTLHPVLCEYPVEGAEDEHISNIQSKAYLIVPGYESRETASLFPPASHTESQQSSRWHNSHPLFLIAPYLSYKTPPRSLIPHLPDDPKSRFLLDLDEEIADVPAAHFQSQTSNDGSQQPSPSKRGGGMWKSVKSIDQFWEMMAYRQECASGRLVGFLWNTFTPLNLVGMLSAEQAESILPPTSPSLRPAKRKRDLPDEDENEKKTVKRRKTVRKQRRKLQGIIIPRTPRAKTASGFSQGISEKTRYYYWPIAGRGDLVVSEKAYQRIHDILLRLDFAGAKTARESTVKWTNEVAVIAGRNANEQWGTIITGTAPAVEMGPRLSTDGRANDLGTALIRRKSQRYDADKQDFSRASSGVNDLTSSLIRRKPKGETEQRDTINTLGSGLVRKKVKA